MDGSAFDWRWAIPGAGHPFQADDRKNDSKVQAEYFTKPLVAIARNTKDYHFSTISIKVHIHTRPSQ